VTISDGSLSTTSSVTVSVEQTLTSLAIDPETATVAIKSRTQFSLIAKDQFGDDLSTRPAVVWSVVSGGGKINSAGVYIAPKRPATVVIKASSAGLSATASIDVRQPPVAPRIRAARAVSASQIDLFWADRSLTEAGFEVEISTDKKTFTPLGLLAPGTTSHSVNGLQANVRYYVRIRVYDDAGLASYSKTVRVRTKPS
jgi:hypothetical protein